MHNTPQDSRTSDAILLSDATNDASTRLPTFVQPSTSRFSAHSIDSARGLIDRQDAADNSPPTGRDSPFFWPTGAEKLSGKRQVQERNPSRWKGFFKGWRLICLGSWLNILLVLIPASWVLSITKEKSHGVVFILCILSLIPLVKLHDLVTRDLAIRIGGSKTGLLNASMSNIVEIVVAFSALRKCELRVVQSSLIGSMLSKLLLVLGLCFFAGGMRFSEQGFDATATQIHSSLLSLSVGAVLLPAAYHFSLSSGTEAELAWQRHNILRMSHGVSIVLLFIYGAYLVFQLWSHTHLYKDQHTKSRRLSLKPSKGAPEPYPKRISESPTLHGDTPRPSGLTPPRRLYQSSPHGSASDTTLLEPAMGHNAVYMPANSTVRLVNSSLDLSGAPITRSESSLGGNGYISSAPSSETPTGRGEKSRSNLVFQETELQEVEITKPKEPQLSWLLTIISLVAVTVSVAVTADWLVESMDGISTTIGKEWIALILLPAVSSVAECMTAVNVSVKDQLTLSISVAVGSTIQTALFVIPLMVTLGWIMNKPLSLLMDPFESLVLYISVQTMSYVVADGKSNWLEGMILVCLYITIAVSFWFYPGSNLPDSMAICSL
ncbi:hypothetical protein BD779DRAFT_577402 [Infundibulicybe gibba]|nr:hypothetical protein BD779DRAFT_577402 [Infundibulicybe gibba]